MKPEQILDALLSLPAMRDPQVSRDGRWVAWTWYQTRPVAEVYVAPTDGSAPPRRLTETPENTTLVSWTPDSRGVIVTQDRGGNERFQLYLVQLERPGEMIPLTEPDPPYFIRGGDLHPNGRWLVYGANVDAQTGKPLEATWIYRHDLQTGERLALARPEKGAYIRPRLNAPGSHILYTRKDRHPAGRQVWLVDIEGREDRELFNFGPQVKASAFWCPDGKRVLVLAETGTHRRLGLWQAPWSAPRWLIDDPQRNIEAAYAPWVSHLGGELEHDGEFEERRGPSLNPRISHLDPKTEMHPHAPFGSQQAVVVEIRQARLVSSLLDLQRETETLVKVREGNLLPLAPASDGTWIGHFYSARQPDELVRFDPADPRPETFHSLSRVWERTQLTPAHLAAAEDFRWRADDGLEIQGWLYRPSRPAQGTIVYVHGGPTSHSQDRLNPQIQFFVSQGFNVLDPNYRGSTGFGLPFQERIKQDGWGGREQDDIRAGIEALIASGIARAGRVGITGTSYGGYSSWCAITRFPPELVAAAAPICGMTDLVVDYETTRPDLRPYSEEMMGGSPQQVPERYHQRSPIHFVDHIRGRLLIVQGAQDPNVTPENVRAVRQALDQAGVAYELLVFDDEGHGIYKPANRRQLYLRLVDFFKRAFG